MKYIRFENEIMEVEDERGLSIKRTFGENVTKLNEELIIVKNNKGNILIPTEKIIKQADTIGELCDELVVYNPANDNFFFPQHFIYENDWETILKPLTDWQKEKGIEVYGAIWTDKGPIYLSKMNENGELELL